MPTFFHHSTLHNQQQLVTTANKKYKKIKHFYMCLLLINYGPIGQLGHPNFQHTILAPLLIHGADEAENALLGENKQLTV